MKKVLKFCCGLLLLPACVGSCQTVWWLAREGVRELAVTVPFLAGVGCWIAIFCYLPRPMWLYVLGHECTHALWAWGFLGKVKQIKVSSRGGMVLLSKSNFLIALAPYFFPLYAVLVALCYWGLGRWFDPGRLRPWFHLLFGAACAFHVTLTAVVLRTRQPDLAEHGMFFSSVVIWFGNAMAAILTLWLLASSQTWQRVVSAIGKDWVAAYAGIWNACVPWIHP